MRCLRTGALRLCSVAAPGSSVRGHSGTKGAPGVPWRGAPPRRTICPAVLKKEDGWKGST